MSTLILSAFLLLFGASLVLDTKIPAWCIGVAAIVAGIAILWRGLGGKS